jgi:hypothetical protein
VFVPERIGGDTDDPKIADLLDATDHEATLRREVREFLRLIPGTLRYLAGRLVRSGTTTGTEVQALVRVRPMTSRVAK